MSTSKDLVEEIHEMASVFGLGDECLMLIKVLESSNIKSPVFTHSQLMTLTGIESPETVQSAVNILRSSRFRLFEQAYRYLDDDDIPHAVEVEQLRIATVDGYLVHPTLGYAIKDFKDRTYVVFIGHKEGLSR